MKRFIIPIFITHKGCTHRCIFCNQFQITGAFTTPDNVKQEVKKYISTQFKKYKGINPKYQKSQISFYGGSFTCLPEKEMLQYLNKAQYFIKKADLNNHKEYKLIDSIRLSTRPDCINENILKILKKNSVETIEIGAQTLDNNLLKVLNRGHTLEDILAAFNLLKKHNFETGIQLLVGVPRETTSTINKNIEILLKIIKPDFIRIYPLIVLKGTLLEKMYLKGEYKPLSIDEAVNRAVLITKACIENNIKVIRIGLQHSKSLEKSIIAGPYSPNFGELVLKKLNL